MKLLAPAARRYARALHSLAVEAEAGEAVRGDLALLRRALAGSPELVRFAGDYLVPHGARARALEALFQPRVQALTWRFLRFLESKRRLGILDEIAEVYEQDEEARSGVIRGTVTTAMALDESRLRAVAERAAVQIGQTVTLTAMLDGALLGGYRLLVGDTVYDYSLAARLRTARTALAEGQG